MAKARKTPEAELARLAKLPRRSDLVLEGGKRTLGVYYRHDGEYHQPHIILWVESPSGLIRHSLLINPQEGAAGDDEQVRQSLLAALTSPGLSPFGPPPAAMPLLGGPLGPGQAVAARTAERGLPAKVVVNDQDLARVAADLLAPAGVAVEVADRLPAFDDAYQTLSAMMGADETAGPPQPFTWDVDPAGLEPLFKAAGRYARRAPWETMLDHPPLAVYLGADGPEPGVETLYASIMGAAGQVLGVAFYYSLEAYERTSRKGEELSASDEDVDAMIEMMRQTGAPIDTVPRDELREMVADTIAGASLGEEGMQEAVEDCLVLFLETEEESDPTYLEWLDAHGITYTPRWAVPSFMRTARGGETRLPDEREVAALALAIEGVNGFVSKYRPLLSTSFILADELTHTTRVGSGAARKTVEVTFPAPGYTWDEEDEDDEDDEEGVDAPLTPPTAAAATTVYRFQVKLAWRKAVWRRIEVRADQTLDDLHEAIQEAFGWDNDHLYAFFLSGRAWDEASAYESPYGDGRSAAGYRLEALPLRQGQQFLYIFDFGDELQHLITLEAIVPGGVQKGTSYPRITERHGANVRQY